MFEMNLLNQKQYSAVVSKSNIKVEIKRSNVMLDLALVLLLLCV